jgi:SAM-dependent methyltransferase
VIGCAIIADRTPRPTRCAPIEAHRNRRRLDGEVRRLAASTVTMPIGLDYSERMLARAVTDNGGPRVGYLRGDARRLLFADGAFDAVCCFGALYLIPDPIASTREMIRVLAPGGRIAITTSHRTDNPFGHASRIVGGWSGLRVFDNDIFPKLFAENGLVDIDQQVHRLLQYVSATRPA